MPVYEYLCESCGHRYEKREGFDAPALQPCASCGHTARRILQAPPILFKGSGFYVTDHRRDGHRIDTPTEKPAAEKPAEKPAETTPTTPTPSSSAPEAVAAG